MWIGLVFFLFEDLIQGCAHTVNRILEAYGEKLGVALPILLTQTQELQQVRFQCTVFCCLFLFPYLFFLGWFLAGRKSGLGAFCLTGLAVSVPHGDLPGAPGALFGGLAAVLAGACCCSPPPWAGATGW